MSAGMLFYFMYCIKEKLFLSFTINPAALGRMAQPGYLVTWETPLL